METNVKHSFTLNLKILRIFGLYPPEKCQTLYKIYGYFMLFCCLVPDPFFGILYFLLETEIDMVQASFNLFVLVALVCYIPKLLPFVRNSRKVKLCIHFYEFAFFSISSNREKQIVEDCVAICRRNSLFFFSCIVVSVITWTTRPILMENYKLPVDVWLPFDPTINPILFFFVYVFVALGVVYSAFVSSAVDPLLAGLAYHTAGQVKILKYNLQNLNEYANKKAKHIDEPSRHAEYKSMIICEKIKECVNHHNLILRFVNEFEECFSTAIFSQFLGGIIVVCFCCLQLSKLEMGINFYLMLFYFIDVLIQIYFYCYYGTTLFEESNTLTTAIYMAKWYEFDINSRKQLLILTERSKKPIILSAGKLINISLETFTMILRRSYSLLAVLKNYY